MAPKLNCHTSQMQHSIRDQRFNWAPNFCFTPFFKRSTYFHYSFDFIINLKADHLPILCKFVIDQIEIIISFSVNHFASKFSPFGSANYSLVWLFQFGVSYHFSNKFMLLMFRWVHRFRATISCFGYEWMLHDIHTWHGFCEPFEFSFHFHFVLRFFFVFVDTVRPI